MAQAFVNHPDRLALANELHARPYQPFEAPGRVLQLALKPDQDEAERDLEEDRAHLIRLLDRYGAAHPAPGARHHTTELGRVNLKWECHTEFHSFTLSQKGESETLFAGRLADHLDPEWIDSTDAHVISAAQIEILTAPSREAAEEMVRGPLRQHFAAESMATSWLLDGNALGMGDFRIHEGGYARFAVILCGQAGPRRIGRACQRLLEIEIYRLMAMLALPIARRVAGRLTAIERDLTKIVAMVQRPDGPTDSELFQDLTGLSAEIERLAADSAFRFGAGRAYEQIVYERLAMLREERFEGRQTFAEFMRRRFDPAMRTVHAAAARLDTLSLRAARVVELLRTRVNLAVEEQNQTVLESMNRRAALQLRLQETVEGLSVVAISYYAVSLAAYMLAPLEARLGIDKTILTAGVTLPIILAVWWFVRRIRRGLNRRGARREEM